MQARPFHAGLFLIACTALPSLAGALIWHRMLGYFDDAYIGCLWNPCVAAHRAEGGTRETDTALAERRQSQTLIMIGVAHLVHSNVNSLWTVSPLSIVNLAVLWTGIL